MKKKYIYLNQDEINWAKEKMLDKGISNPVALFFLVFQAQELFQRIK